MNASVSEPVSSAFVFKTPLPALAAEACGDMNTKAANPAASNAKAFRMFRMTRSFSSLTKRRSRPQRAKHSRVKASHRNVNAT